MRILYDYQGLVYRAGGVSRCLVEIISELKKSENVGIACPFTDNLYLQEVLGYKVNPLSRRPWLWKQLIGLNKPYCKLRLSSGKYDLFHPTFDKSYYFKGLKKPFVVTVHDMIPEVIFRKEKSYDPRKLERWLDNKHNMLKDAARIICVSGYTRKTMLETYPEIDPAKVDVIHHGMRPFHGTYGKNTRGRYILYVGMRTGYKNFLFSVKALKPVFDKDDSLKLYCTGKAFTAEEAAFIADCGLSDKVLCTGYLSDDALASLYHNAAVFIYPSRFEGFGIPILEAFEYGCPAAVADATCFPEVGGDAVEYFDPDSAESLMASVCKILEDETYADSLRLKGKMRVSGFTWEKTAARTLETYKKVLE